MSLKTWMVGLPIWAKASSVIGVLVVGIFTAGWNIGNTVHQQVGLPATVSKNTERIESLEAWKEESTLTMDSIRINAAHLGTIARLVDSLFVLDEDTYCLVRAHSYGLDPDVACHATRRGGGTQEESP